MESGGLGGGADVSADRADKGLAGLARADISGADLGPSLSAAPGSFGAGGGMPSFSVNPIAEALRQRVANLNVAGVLGSLLGGAFSPLPGGAQMGFKAGSALAPNATLGNTPSFSPGGVPGGPMGATLAGGSLGGQNLGTANLGTSSGGLAQILSSHPVLVQALLQSLLQPRMAGTGPASAAS